MSSLNFIMGLGRLGWVNSNHNLPEGSGVVLGIASLQFAWHRTFSLEQEGKMHRTPNAFGLTHEWASDRY